MQQINHSSESSKPTLPTLLARLVLAALLVTTLTLAGCSNSSNGTEQGASKSNTGLKDPNAGKDGSDDLDDPILSAITWVGLDNKPDYLTQAEFDEIIRQAQDRAYYYHETYNDIHVVEIDICPADCPYGYVVSLVNANGESLPKISHIVFSNKR